ncbi:MAG: hypothetical protein EOP45_11555 [Sphingobacteriaceae bacterium]|nr:MAG: hypothetical protein EOP45_11555 [Sphingobacteriaceae bacterium]
MKRTLNHSPIILLIPVLGILLFITLYVIATLLYPGGSQANIHSKGFSWLHNYWCNLLNDNAMNGQPNPAKPVALAGMATLCVSLSFFWYSLPRYLPMGKVWNTIIQATGTASMVMALFLFTSLHDGVINIACLLGLIALTGLYSSLYKNRWYWLFGWGIFNLLLIGVNNYVYYTSGMIVYLPVVQKISFASFLGFISCICVRLYYRLQPDKITNLTI